jgi:hypothetical protein
MALAHVAGIVLASGGTGLALQVLVNVAGIGGLYAIARASKASSACSSGVTASTGPEGTRESALHSAALALHSCSSS